MLKKIIRYPAADVVITCIIAYLLTFKTAFLGELLIVKIPGLFGIDFMSIMGEDLYSTWYLYFSFIAVWICGLAIISVFRDYRPIWRSFSPRLKGNNIKTALIVGLSLGAGLNLLIAFAAMAAGAIKLHYVGLGFGSFVLLLIAVLIQSGAEELVSRAFIYQRLRKSFPKWPVIAIVGNGLFFAMIHLGNTGVTFLSVCMILLIAVVYSLAVYYFDSIWIPIVAHTTWNFMQSIILGLPNSGYVFPVSMFRLDAGTDHFTYDSVFGIEGSVLALIIYAIVCVGMFCYGRKKGPSETNIWDDSAWNVRV